MNYFDVIIATPGKIFNEYYVQSILKTTNMLNEKNVSWFWANAYNPHLGLSRQSLMTDNQIGTKIIYNKIFWIDSDIFWEPEDFLKLYNSSKDIICGSYILNPETTNTKYEDFPISVMKDWIPNNLNRNTYRNTIKDIVDFKDLTEINETGFGFICVKKHVFDSFKGLYFFSTKVKNFYIFSEDTSWCYNVKKMGYKIYFDKNVLVGHTKNVFLDWKK